MIYHILPRTVYNGLDTGPDAQQAYAAPTLTSEGFIHCTGEPEWLVQVANRFYGAEQDAFVVVCIDEERVLPPVRWEEADGHLFPHIYGPLNWDAVEGVIDFPRTADGVFTLPPELE